MLLEEFENTSAVIEPTDTSIRGGGETCNTLILSFNGEIIKRVAELENVYEELFTIEMAGCHGIFMNKVE